jgi:hypothetical protein
VCECENGCYSPGHEVRRIDQKTRCMGYENIKTPVIAEHVDPSVYYSNVLLYKHSL